MPRLMKQTQMETASDSEFDEGNMLSRPRVKKNKSCYRRYALPIVLILITVISCAMTIVTAVVYYNKEHTHVKEGHPFQNPASQLPINLTLDDNVAYAHKLLLFDKEASADSKIQKLRIEPNTNYGAYEVSEGVRLLRQGIQIEHPGTYFTYKSIYFTPDARSECKKSNLTEVYSYLMLNSTLNSGGVTVLLRSHHACCPTCQDIIETAFSGGVFYFQQGDIIQVEVEGKDLVDVEKDVSYVGLMKLGTLKEKS